MKNLIKIGCLTALISGSLLLGASIEEKQYESIKGVSFETYGVIIEKGSEVEKELKNVLIKYNKIEPIKEEKKITVLDPIIVNAKVENINLKSCTSCHGENFEKAALGKSKIVKDLTKEEIKTALNGYKDGTYGKEMKNIMKPQVIKYSEEDIANIAEQIGK